MCWCMGARKRAHAPTHKIGAVASVDAREESQLLSKSVSDFHHHRLWTACVFALSMLKSPWCVGAVRAHLRTHCTNTQKQCGRAADARAGARKWPQHGRSLTRSKLCSHIIYLAGMVLAVPQAVPGLWSYLSINLQSMRFLIIFDRRLR
ncbi:hypothetical protein KDAU_28050 [Dictyobacter aurantiacus]|uniref:Uncharacterized protein n=1 Tax=Dictyobacter aurantiacus TaxID=1936993 RepID=A0A401ZF55_9CHLR|nr:hypothetical protein KDAU_28050 [Dictyobacter aurantiacus]